MTEIKRIYIRNMHKLVPQLNTWKLQRWGFLSHFHLSWFCFLCKRWMVGPIANTVPNVISPGTNSTQHLFASIDLANTSSLYQFTCIAQVVWYHLAGITVIFHGLACFHPQYLQRHFDV